MGCDVWHLAMFSLLVNNVKRLLHLSRELKQSALALLKFITKPHRTSDEKAEELSQKLLRMGTNFNR